MKRNHLRSAKFEGRYVINDSKEMKILCCLGKSNSHFAIVEYSMVHSHKNITQDPASIA